ncbi:unnamed protein product [Echinostoma caproni]|uniref:Uncharacterized protein n=1 Tax=Echinostoma caproni TaxID=27848 RepID=A0A3P8KTX1_9TREM|nr:unnamed protein product [Echinostoma caproni]
MKHYYRDFRYDVDRGEFRMGRDSSDEDEEEEEAAGTAAMTQPDGAPPTIRSRLSSRKKEKYSKLNSNNINSKGFTNSAGQFDWAAAYGSDPYPDIYRSAKSLPRDLEELLYRMENQEVVDNEELSTLRVRLEQTEREMMRLLHAMDAAEHMVKQSSSDEVNQGDPFTYVPHHHHHHLVDNVEWKQNKESSEDEAQDPHVEVEQDENGEVENVQDSEYESATWVPGRLCFSSLQEADSADISQGFAGCRSHLNRAHESVVVREAFFDDR